MKTVVNALLEISLYAAVITGGILLFQQLFKKRISARLNYLCWALLLFRLLLPVTVESGLHVDQLLPQNAIEAPAAQTVADVPLPTEQAVQHKAGVQPQAQTAPSTAQPAIVKPKPVDGYALAFALWCAGAVLMLGWLCTTKLRFNSRMCRRAVEAEEDTVALYRDCAKLVGVMHTPRLLICEGEDTASLCLLRGRATVLLPRAILQEPDTLRFTMLHELTHYKHKDHLVLLVCMLLRCAYWFHPVVWFAFSQMQADMETACDAGVISVISPEEKRGYLCTLLTLFTCNHQPVLGMAKYHTKRLAKKRVEGAFMKPKTGMGAKAAAVILSLALVFGCFTTACQPSPAQTAEPQSWQTGSGGESVQPISISPVNTVSSAQSGQILQVESHPAPAENDSTALQPVRSRYEVRFDAAESVEAVKQNLSIAADRINADGGMLIMPEEEWSFQKAMGLQDESHGWMKAAEGTAGVQGGYEGVCEIASALYGALLTGDVEVTEHKNHATPVPYIDLGLDAAVSAGGTDLQFVNNTGMLLRMLMTWGLQQSNRANDSYVFEVAIELHGAPLPEGITYALRSELTEVIPMGEPIYSDDPTFPVGAERVIIEGHDGFRAEVYRDTVEADKTVQSELLYTAVYKGNPPEIARNTGESTALEPERIADIVKEYIGKPYALGAAGPNSFDASGLLYWTLRQAGMEVQRDNCAGYAEKLAWERIEDMAALQSGDVLFFNNNDDAIAHCGIYIGDKQMIHASSANGKVVKSSCDTDYWRRHFAFAGRLA